MTLTLKPLAGGAFTQLCLRGPLCSAPERRVLQELIRAMAFWSGWPVQVVLHVDAQTAGWCEVWTDALAAVPMRDLEVRFESARSISGESAS